MQGPVAFGNDGTIIYNKIRLTQVRVNEIGESSKTFIMPEMLIAKVSLMVSRHASESSLWLCGQCIKLHLHV